MWAWQPLTPSSGGGGTAHIKIANEAVGLADARVTTLARVRLLAEALGLAEAVVKALGIRRVRSEPEGLTEASVKALGVIRQRAEALGLTETAVRVRGITRALAEALGITEAVVRVKGIVRQAAEAIGLTEVRNVTQAMRRTVSDAVGVTEAFVRTLVMVRLANEVLAIVESSGAGLEIILIYLEDLGVTETVARIRGLFRQVTDALGVTETTGHIAGIVRLASEAMAITEATVHLLASFLTKVVAEAVAIAESTPRILPLIRVVAEQLGVTELATRVLVLLRVRTEALGILEARDRVLVLLRVVTEQMGLAEVIRRLVEMPGVAIVLITTTILPAVKAALAALPAVAASLVARAAVTVRARVNTGEAGPVYAETPDEPYGLYGDFAATQFATSNADLATWTLAGGAVVTPGQRLRKSTLFNLCTGGGTITRAAGSLAGVTAGQNLNAHVLWRRSTAGATGSGFRLRVRDTTAGVDRLDIAWDSDSAGRPTNIVKLAGASAFNFVEVGVGEELYRLYVYATGFVAANAHEVILSPGTGCYFGLPGLTEGKFPQGPLLNTTSASRVVFGDAGVRFIGAPIVGASVGFFGAKQKLFWLEDLRDAFAPSAGFLPAITGAVARCYHRVLANAPKLKFREVQLTSGAGTDGVLDHAQFKNRTTAYVTRFDGASQHAYAGGQLNRTVVGFGGFNTLLLDEYDIQVQCGITYSIACYSTDLGEAAAIAVDASGVTTWPEDASRTVYHDFTTRTVPAGWGNVSTSTDRLSEDYEIVAPGVPRFARRYF